MDNKKIQHTIKRINDLIIGSSLLILAFPLLLVIVIIVKLTSPGPSLFIQTRPGLHGKPFRILKIRTMYLGSERMEKGIEVTLEDPRITTIGRFLRRMKIDELPQLINVIKGEMSLVGPRPERMESLANYSEDIKKRLEMRPGMTGLAQVSGNIYLGIEKRYLLDIYYIKNFSIILDIQILFKTLSVIIFGEDRVGQKSL